MPRRLKKIYSKPRKLYNKAQIKEENDLIKKYGLKNRREVWKADFAVQRIRNIAKSLITAEESEKKKFVERQKKKGFSVESIADVLALNKEDYLKRRLQSILVKKGLARTHKQARQFIVHKQVIVNGKVIDAPSHLTTLDEEANITLKISIPVKPVIDDSEKKLIESISHSKEEKKIVE